MSLAGQAVPFILSQPALSLSKLPSKLEFELQGLLTGASFFMAEKSRCFPPFVSSSSCGPRLPPTLTPYCGY